MTRRVAGCMTVAVLAAGLVLTCAVAPAEADTRRFRDRAGETGVESDITRVSVTNGARGGRRLVVKAAVGDLAPEDSFLFFVDTRRRNAGPEYLVRLRPNSTGPLLRRIAGWGDVGSGHAVRCRGLRGKADAFGRDRVQVSVPRRCVHTPRQVRIGIQARFPYPNRVIVDWAPKRRSTFGRVHV